MATLLLVVIYIAFIGLGIPDSLFGAAWPAMYPELGVPVSTANIITTFITACTVFASVSSAKVIRRFGTPKVAAVSTLMTAVGLFGFSCSNHVLWFCLFGIPLGLGAGAIDSALNNYVALHYQASHMNFLHCFYGIGVSLSPYLMSVALAHTSWQAGYRMAAYVQTAIVLIAFLSLPIWSKAHPEAVGEEETKNPLSLTQVVRLPKLWNMVMIFLTSCGVECTCGIWGSTFLVQAKGLSADTAAWVIMFFYIGMALGRFLSGVLSAKISSWGLIRLGELVMVVAFLLLLLPAPAAVSGVGLFLIGLGNGPVFPNLIHLTPKIFGEETSQSVMGVQMGAAYVGIMVIPVICGVLIQEIAAEIFVGYNLIFFLLMLFFVRTMQKKK